MHLAIPARFPGFWILGEWHIRLEMALLDFGGGCSTAELCLMRVNEGAPAAVDLHSNQSLVNKMQPFLPCVI